MLMGRLRMLLGHVRLLLAFRMVALAVMFGGRTVSLGRIFVVFGGFVMFVSCHCGSRWLVAPLCIKTGTCCLFRQVPARCIMPIQALDSLVESKSKCCEGPEHPFDCSIILIGTAASPLDSPA